MQSDADYAHAMNAAAAAQTLADVQAAHAAEVALNAAAAAQMQADATAAADYVSAVIPLNEQFSQSVIAAAVVRAKAVVDAEAARMLAEVTALSDAGAAYAAQEGTPEAQHEANLAALGLTLAQTTIPAGVTYDKAVIDAAAVWLNSITSEQSTTAAAFNSSALANAQSVIPELTTAADSPVAPDFRSAGGQTSARRVGIGMRLNTVALVVDNRP